MSVEIVSRLSFTGPDAIRAVQRAYMAALPFGLTFGDSSDVAEKLGAGPFREGKSSTLLAYSAVRFDHLQALRIQSLIFNEACPASRDDAVHVAIPPLRAIALP